MPPDPPSYRVDSLGISRQGPHLQGPALHAAPARQWCSVSARALSTCTAWGRVLREPRPRPPLPPSAPPPPRAAAAAAGAQSSSRPATPPPPPQPRPARSRGSRVGAESAPRGEYADPSPAPLTWLIGSHHHPKEEKKKKKAPGLSCASPPFHLLRDPEVPGPHRTQRRHALSPNPHRPWPDVSPPTPVGAPDVRFPLPPPRRNIPRGGTPLSRPSSATLVPPAPSRCAALLGSQLLPSRRRR